MYRGVEANEGDAKFVTNAIMGTLWGDSGS